MEQIVGESLSPQSESHAPRLKLSPLFLIVFTVFIGFAVLNVAVRLVAQYGSSAKTLTPIFSSSLPGQLANAADLRGFSCQSNTQHGSEEETCSINRITGDFSRLEVLIENNVIYQTTFQVRENTLRLGDLIRALGTPEIHPYGHYTYFYWHVKDVIVTTVLHAKQYTLFFPLRDLYLSY